MKYFCKFITFALFMSLQAYGEEVAVRTPTGESVTVEVSEEQSFLEVIDQVNAIIAATDTVSEKKTYFLDFMFEPASYQAATTARNYYMPVSAFEKEKITYIVTNLATLSWPKLLGKQKKLNAAGDAIDNVHPLRFLMCIFTDEALKGCLATIRDRSIIWKQFTSGDRGGIFLSLSEELSRNNMRPEFIQDFANTLKINSADIAPLIQSGSWTQFIDTLFRLLPRQGNPGRLDM